MAALGYALEVGGRMGMDEQTECYFSSVAVAVAVENAAALAAETDEPVVAGDAFWQLAHIFAAGAAVDEDAGVEKRNYSVHIVVVDVAGGAGEHQTLQGVGQNLSSDLRTGHHKSQLILQQNCYEQSFAESV